MLPGCDNSSLQNTDRRVNEKEMDALKAALKEKIELRNELAEDQESHERAVRRLAAIEENLTPIQEKSSQVAMRLTERYQVDMDLSECWHL